jgi:hypothetical protein
VIAHSLRACVERHGGRPHNSYRLKWLTAIRERERRATSSAFPETRDISPPRSDLGERESRRVVGKSNNQEEIVNFDVASIIVRFIKGIFDSPCSLLLREYTRFWILNRLRNIRRAIRFSEQTTARLCCTCHPARHRTPATVWYGRVAVLP